MQTVDFKHFPLQSGDKVLDLGCGEGRHVIAAYLEQDVDAIGVDLSLDDLQSAQQKHLPFIQADNPSKSFSLSVADALRLPFADSSFDKIICSEVLEHIPNFEAVLNEIERILKPQGLLCVSVPRAWPEQLCWWLSDAYHQVEGGHLRIFNAIQLNNQIEALGFTSYRKHWAHALHSPYWWLRCLFWQGQDDNWLVKQYHRFLVWDLMDKPVFTRRLEQLLNPLMGKSVVMYFRKPAKTGSQQ